MLLPLEDAQSVLDDSQVVRTARGVFAVKLYSLASFEVEYIWKQRFTFFTILWFLNRYLSPLGFIVIIISFHDRGWTENDKLCNTIALFPEILRSCTTTIIGLIFILRLYATFRSSKIILASMTCLLVLEEAVKIWSLISAQRLQLPAGFVGCILTTGSDSLRFAFTWIAELGFACDGFGWVASGVVYFAIISATNLATVLTFLPYLKAVNASFTVSITTLMVSRLILNLRTAGTAVVTNTRGGLDAESPIEGGLNFASRMRASGPNEEDVTEIFTSLST
ncbi:hypothetical protein HYPSUDRAFT_56830 [Hypholoma sublateritium FD-334 SS-4]|uniref:DUF6533 domain-containing protein n=1 Tax=Hypholoma sublateritium (strain FD-334 SS-4) TaxID=945553 RepID=A0A0D2PGD5_HYPSF|nr:hypothetical protein HYPSUDRAFT_56830 [Hypholoma sublateritium FD-334 SS-4]